VWGPSLLAVFIENKNGFELIKNIKNFYIHVKTEEQTARAISAHAQCACLHSLQMGSIN
jgi:hypothetical protein